MTVWLQRLQRCGGSCRNYASPSLEHAQHQHSLVMVIACGYHALNMLAIGVRRSMSGVLAQLEEAPR